MQGKLVPASFDVGRRRRDLWGRAGRKEEGNEEDEEEEEEKEQEGVDEEAEAVMVR